MRFVNIAEVCIVLFWTSLSHLSTGFRDVFMSSGLISRHGSVILDFR